MHVKIALSLHGCRSQDCCDDQTPGCHFAVGKAGGFWANLPFNDFELMIGHADASIILLQK